MQLLDSTARSTEGYSPLTAGPVRVIAVSGGKGGVGKTTVAINLATALTQAGQRVMLLDGDLGLANVDVLLGLAPRYTLAHVLSGERTLEEIIVEAPSGLLVAPAASGVARMANLSPAEHLGLVRAFSGLAAQIDTLVVDTSAGIADGVLRFSQAAQHVLLVLRDEPASITDAYALIKVLSREHGVQRFRVLVNMSRDAGDGTAVFARLQRVALRYLEVALEYVGEVPDDPWLGRAIREQRPVTEAYPSSRASVAFKKLARLTDTWPIPAGPRGHLEFFVERLVRRTGGGLEVVQ
jgi:flagellar biosynthesis protein FlhG